MDRRDRPLYQPLTCIDQQLPQATHHLLERDGVAGLGRLSLVPQLKSCNLFGTAVLFRSVQ
jgi:hypothetical protein